MPERLDAKDQRILAALSANARQSLSSVGRKVGLSEEVVNYRLRNLLQKRIITAFRAEIDPFRLGYRGYRLYIRLEGADAEKEKEIYDYLAKTAEWIAACEGKYNLVYRFIARDEFELNEIVNDISAKFSGYIREKDLTIPIEWNFYHSQSGVFKPGKPKYEEPSKKGLAKIDEKDMRIIGILAGNARVPGSEIAQKIGLTPNAVRYRIARLEGEKIIKGYEVAVDRTFFGLYHYKLLMHLKSTEEGTIWKLVRHCENLPNLVFLVRSIGPWEMDIDFDFKSALELHNSVLGLGSRFREIVRNYETLSIFKCGYENPYSDLKRFAWMYNKK
ncbi:MAG: AsnC family transcriptional regulator [Candidatus Micrarchaeota archaeon]